MKSKIPVTIITGFLGSGKTTLLNNFIKKYPEKKFAVIENEFGEIGIDSQLISKEVSGIFELANGCICCTLNEDFYLTLSKLMESEFKFTHLLVETTGIADPLSVVRLFLTHPEIQNFFRIDSVICVADVTILKELIEEMPEIRKQIAVSDTILLNKADLSSRIYIEEAVNILNTVNSIAHKHTTAFSDITDLRLLNTDSYSALSIERSVNRIFSAEVKQDQRQKFMKPSVKKSHSSDFSSEAFVFDKPFRFDSFALWMKQFLYFNERTVLRAKGIIAFEGKLSRFIFHSVFGSYMLTEGSAWENEHTVSKFVFIGRYLDRQEIETGLAQLVVDDQKN